MAASGFKSPLLQRIIWMGDSLEVVRLFPKAVRDEVGFALYEAQLGGKHVNAKALRGLGTGMLEGVSEFRGDTYRAIYTVRFKNRIYVLHAFQKKSKRGIATPAREIELVRRRLKQAMVLDQTRED